ncbi:MAG: DNA-binding response regulator [Synechococcaceae bacterium WB4_1_0192]|jgi:two-component system response regulator DevR|nr:DNA-binding response regulator [Synechococcaceae bacterium WB4_1_0192]
MSQSPDPAVHPAAGVADEWLGSATQLRRLLGNRKLLVGNRSIAYASMLSSNLLRLDASEPLPELLAITSSQGELAAALAGARDDLLLATTSRLRDGCCVPLILEILAGTDPPQLLVMLGMDEPALPLAPLLEQPAVALVWEGNVGQGVVLEAVAQLQRGTRFLDPDVRRLVEADLAIAGSLTAREREVLGLLAEGLTNRQIAERIVVAEVTARDHVQRILHKLAVPDRTAAAVLGLRLGLVD